MKHFGMFLATSCLGIALASTNAAAQEPPPSQPGTQDQQTQQPQQPQAQPGTQTQTTQTQTTTQKPQGRLPRTASPMPLVGLAGMLSLAAAGVMRKLRRSVA